MKYIRLFTQNIFKIKPSRAFVCALRHLIHSVLLGYLLCYSVRCYIKARPSSCTISIFPANPALAALAWQNVIGRRQLGAKSNSRTCVELNCHVTHSVIDT